MASQDFTTAILVDHTPEQAYNAINNVRGWWSEEIEGDTDRLNAEFTYHYEDVHRCHIKVDELVPGKKVSWQVVQNYFKFTKDSAEWTGTRIEFRIEKKADKTEVRLTHFGLTPEFECFDICKNGWTQYIQQSLVKLISTGKGQPNATGKPQTEDEKKLSVMD